MQLAILFEQQGQKANAKNFYQILAQQKMDLGEHDEASLLLQKACNLEPECSQSFLKLAQQLELQGKSEEAIRCYFQSANLLADQNKTAEAITVTENVLRICPKNKEIIKALFRLLESRYDRQLNTLILKYG
jgi:tetratricopeptide (TPR) repeat protein